MAPEVSRKRSLPSKVAKMLVHKRQKLENPAKAPAGKRAKTIPRKTIQLENMRWKTSALPDQMEDYEGFYEMEELSDVEVIKEEGGKISYRMAGVEIADMDNANGGSQENGADEDKEWGGISEGEDTQEVEPIKVNGAQEKKPEKRPEKKVLEQKAVREEPKQPLSAVEGVKKLNKRERQRLKREERMINAVPDPPAIQNGFAVLENAGSDDEADVSEWDSLNLSTEAMSSIAKLKFSQPTAIQSLAIPEILAGHDVIGKASTGSGKTLAFGIPILEYFLSTYRNAPSKDKRRPPTALILSPTRELAHQLDQHLTALCSHGTFNGPSIATLTGGLSMQKQQRILEKADIVIGTPGRLWEVISEGHGLISWLQQVRFLVVDEADRLLSEGHFKEIEEILNALDRKVINEDEEDDEEESRQQPRQTLVFSATFHKGLQQKLAGKSKPSGDLMNKKESMEYLIKKLNFREDKPKFIDANPVSQMAEGLKEGIIECPGTEKDLYLYSLLLMSARVRTLVFTNSISAVRRITPFLTNLSLPAIALHSQMPQKSRLRSIERFTASQNSILVATDVAARGLDIPGVRLVIHYHVPRTADMYVHRSGRTARAENEGKSVLLCSPDEVNDVRRLVVKVHATASTGKKGSLRSLSLDPRAVSRLRPRVQLAKQIADTELAKEKSRHEDSVFMQAAEDLGIEYDSEAFEEMDSGRRGRGKGRKKKEREARDVSKGEVAGMKAELKGLLSQRVNVGVSERYITGGLGGVDVDSLVKGERNEFLGMMGGVEGW